MAPEDSADKPAWTFLVPDAINLTSIAGEMVAYGDIPFDRPQRYDLTFEGWIAATDSVSPTEAVWRRGLRIPTISATVTLVETGEASIKNRVVILLRQEYQTEVDRQKTPGVNVGGDLLFEGQLKGPKAELERLAREPEGWFWGIELKDPSELPDDKMNDGPSPWKKVRARFRWCPTSPDLRDRGIEFLPKEGQDDFDIKVRWNKRKP